MSKNVGYGVCIRNTPIDIKKTVAYQELTAIGFDETNMVIDVVRSDASNRPNLEELINKLSPGDQIHMYSIDTLLLGNCKRAFPLYSAILEKGIDLLAFDFSGAIAKLSSFSTLRFGDRKAGEGFFEKTLKSHNELTYEFSEYLVDAMPEKNSGGLRTKERLNISNDFKEIYFAYESYQINQEDTLRLLDTYCGIGSKITFWLMAKDYETSLDYSDDLSKQPFEILDLPKRCGKLPEEYHQISKLADSYIGTITNEQERVELAMRTLNMVGGYNVYRRWQLLAEKVPKPRTYVTINFNIEKFEKKHKKT